MDRHYLGRMFHMHPPVYLEARAQNRRTFTKLRLVWVEIGLDLAWQSRCAFAIISSSVSGSGSGGGGVRPDGTKSQSAATSTISSAAASPPPHMPSPTADAAPIANLCDGQGRRDQSGNRVCEFILRGDGIGYSALSPLKELRSGVCSAYKWCFTVLS